ncbi:MAG: sulfite exporter TauE/SafE family protein [Gemmatimonadota bacterium]|nr:sulfite exporter TauE/SafE family protein [Gemmatimonadota bacterium]
MLLLLTALALGAMHSFAPDHLAAVSVFVSRRPSWRRAMSLGARWGLGHSLTVLIVGGTLALSGLRMPERFATNAERAVGVVLIVIGVAALARSARLHVHTHAHDDGTKHWHLHGHASAPTHDHGHGALLGIGMLHGLAGTGALVVALPAVVAASRGQALLYLICFGAGTILSMAMFGAAAGHALRAASRSSARVLRFATLLAGASSVGVGAWWLAVGGA